MKKYIQPLLFASLLSLATSVVFGASQTNESNDQRAAAPPNQPEVDSRFFGPIEDGARTLGTHAVAAATAAGAAIRDGAHAIVTSARNAQQAIDNSAFSRAVRAPTDEESAAAQQQLGPVSRRVAGELREFAGHYQRDASTASDPQANAHRPDNLAPDDGNPR